MLVGVQRCKGPCRIYTPVTFVACRFWRFNIICDRKHILLEPGHVAGRNDSEYA